MNKSVYEMVTERIIAELENGSCPWDWIKPWNGVRTGAYNYITKKPYSLLNQMLLKPGGYLTFNQVQKLGGKIKKGSKSSIIVFWKIHNIEEEQEDGTKKIKQIPLLKYYSVFNVETQIIGIEPLKPEELHETEPIPEPEELFSNYLKRENIRLEQTASNEAYYSPSRDIIHLPLLEQFSRPEDYYGTSFHEAIHSTGAKHRLDRLNTGANAAFGSETYSKEELVAEIGSSFILNLLGIESQQSFRNNTAYIQSWLQVLRNDTKFIVSASTKAEKAVNYILHGREAEA